MYSYASDNNCNEHCKSIRNQGDMCFLSLWLGATSADTCDMDLCNESPDAVSVGVAVHFALFSFSCLNFIAYDKFYS